VDNVTIPQIEMNKAFTPYLFDYSHRFSIYWGGRMSGKTYFVTDKYIIKSMNDKRRILFVKKFGNSIQDTIWEIVCDELDRFGLSPYCKFTKSPFKIILPNGSEFIFKGFDDESKAKGLAKLTDIFVDEANDITWDDFNALNKSLRHSTALGQEFILAFNPVTKQNWCYKYWFANGDLENTFYHHSTFKDNAFLQQINIDDIEYTKKFNPAQYNIDALGLWGSLGKLVYPTIRKEEFDYKNIEGRRQYGLDFGYSAPTGFTANIVDEENRKIYIFDEIYQTDLDNQQIGNLLIHKGYGKCEIWCDNAEPKSIKELQKYGVVRAKASIKGADSVKYGIQKINQYEIIVHPTKCPHTIIELENYSYKKIKGTSDYSDDPDKEAGFCHILDALRYSFGSNIKNNKLKVIKNFRF
jgi:phage terminase large subunit